jgi:hypothetical protein
MPTAICNNCKSLVHYHGKFIKQQHCACVNSYLTSVSGKLNNDATGWDYYDRKQNFVKHQPFINVPRDTYKQTHEQNQYH